MVFLYEGMGVVRRRFDYRALGRLKTGQMNRTEESYANYLEGQRRAGIILWFKFEGIKLRLADNTHLTVDFAVMTAALQLEMHEVKGRMIDDAAVKLKVAADLYPFVFKLVRRGGGGVWTIQEV